MSEVLRQRCYLHSGREASARCPECNRYYCRECVTEHEGRIRCADCLRREAESPVRRRRGASVASAIQGICGVVVLWILFWSLGELLLMLPDTFHSGELWRAGL